jgi:hypothetical protein
MLNGEALMAEYRHDWDLGKMSGTVTAAKAMAILQSQPNLIFPFQVKGRAGETDIRVNSTYDLVNTTGPLDSFGTGPDPVQVQDVSVTSFTFLTLAGHHRGAGQTITFETYEKLSDENGSTSMYMHVYLTQHGTYIASFMHPFSTMFNWCANVGAAGAWGLQAHNLRVALGTNGQDGLATAEAAVDKVLGTAYKNIWPGG